MKNLYHGIREFQCGPYERDLMKLWYNHTNVKHI